MKKSINAWSFPNPDDLETGLRLAKDAGFEAVEPNLAVNGPVSLTASESDIRKVADRIRKAGLEISSVCTGVFWETSLTASDPAVREEAKRRLRRLIEVGAWMGTDAVLVVPGAVDVCFIPSAEVVPYDRVFERSREAIREAVPLAAAKSVTICIENVWNGFLLSPLEMRDFIDYFESPHVCAYFDVGNVVRFGHPEQWIRILAERIKRVHFKDFRWDAGNLVGFVDLLSGDVNWPEIIKAFGEIGYDSYVTAEMGKYRHHPEAVLYTTSLAMDFILGRR